MSSLRHIAGSVFGLQLTTEQCPITDPTGGPVDTTNWGIALRMVGQSYTTTIEGQWLETAGPTWSMAFEVRDTLAWPVGSYAVRMVYTEPGSAGRRFEIETDMRLEVIR